MDSVNNMELWDSVCKTDPSAVKPITGKQYKGSSPKPYWLIEHATRTFGPAGLGWGHDIIGQGFQQCGQDDMLHWAIVEFWYMKDNKRCSVQQMGGTKAMYKTNAGKMMVDEDAPKKSVTDALVKAMSSVGFAGDISQVDGMIQNTLMKLGNIIKLKSLRILIVNLNRQKVEFLLQKILSS